MRPDLRFSPALVLVLAALLASVVVAPPRRAAGQTTGSSSVGPDTLTVVRAARLALAEHPSVATARAGRRSARARVREARSAWLPEVASGGTLVRFEEPMPVAPFHGLDPGNRPAFDRTLVQSSLDLSYRLLDWGRSGRIALAEARAGAADADLREREMDLVAGVVQAYLEVLTLGEVVEAHRARVTALREEMDRARRFVAQGTAPRVEELRAEAAASRARADLRSSEVRLGLARRDLGRLTGLSEEQVEALALRSVGARPATPREDQPPSVPDGVEAPRAAGAGAADGVSGKTPPALARALHRLEAAEAGRSVARAAWLPTLSAGGGLHQFGAVGERFTYEWQGSLRISYPLFTGGARRAANDGAQADLEGAREGVRMTRLETRSRIDRAVAALEEARFRVRALVPAVEQFEEVARIEALALANGAGVQQDLLDAQAALLDARAELVRARNGVVVGRAALARARGVLDLEWLETHLETRP